MLGADVRCCLHTFRLKEVYGRINQEQPVSAVYGHEVCLNVAVSRRSSLCVQNAKFWVLTHLIVLEIEGKRPLRRRRRRWEDNIKIDVQEVGWGVD
jgi:hypothetical protein